MKASTVIHSKGSLNSEFSIHLQVVRYLELQYPSVIFYSDMKGAFKLSMYQAKTMMLHQKIGVKMTDLMIFRPNNTFCGLFIELKKEIPYRKDGKLKAGEHLLKQSKTIENLNNVGYYATFCWDFETAKALIDSYFKNTLQKD